MAASGFTAEAARQYLATVQARGEITLAKPVSQLSDSYAKRTANALQRQERAGKQLSLSTARGHKAGEGKPSTIKAIPAQGKVSAKNQIGTFPTRLAPERNKQGKLETSGVYRNAKVPQVPDLIKLVNRSTKTNTITIGLYAYINFYFDEKIKPGIHWVAFVADKQEFLRDLQALNTGQIRKADDPGLRGLAMKYLNYKRKASEATDVTYIFGWFARDARQP